jgi:hypothetical protein
LCNSFCCTSWVLKLTPGFHPQKVVLVGSKSLLATSTSSRSVFHISPLYPRLLTAAILPRHSTAASSLHGYGSLFPRTMVITSLCSSLVIPKVKQSAAVQFTRWADQVASRSKWRDRPDARQLWSPQSDSRFRLHTLSFCRVAREGRLHATLRVPSSTRRTEAEHLPNQTEARVHELGGKTVLPKTAEGTNGFYINVTDPEGNRFGLYELGRANCS